MTRQPTPDILSDVLTNTQDDVTLAMGAQAQRVATVHIRLDGGTQPRAGIDQAVVDDYHSDMQAGAQFPPVELVYDGTNYWLWDGFHRFHALRKDGDRLIAANVRQGTRRDAVLLSVGANATHGFRRTNEDKRRSVLALLHDDEWRQWSDREIARRCAVSNQFVSNVRSGLSVNDGQMETRRVVRQGTEYDMAVPQRTAAPALASQGVKWASQVDLQLAIGDWLDAFDDPGAVLDELARDGQGSVLWEDVAGSMPVHREADLVVAIAAFRERMAATRKQLAKPDAKRPHVANNSGDNEWYTPQEFIDAAVAVMGQIDLDPASTATANTVVQAGTFYTIDDQALEREWHGAVWMNPPYSQPAINHFVNKLVEEYEAGRVTQAIVLVNNATETVWFNNLVYPASAVCFPVGRVRFWTPDRIAAPLQGQAIVYLGDNTDAFIAKFHQLGWTARIEEPCK